MKNKVKKVSQYDKVIDLRDVKDRKGFYSALGWTRRKISKPKMVGLNVLDFRVDSGIQLNDKELLVFIGIGMECCYRNIAYISREDVQRFANIQKSTFWRAYSKLKKLGLIVESGLTLVDRKDKIVFVHPDYFYCGSEAWRWKDTNRWAMGSKTLGLEDIT
jgi:hypothetical protein